MDPVDWFAVASVITMLVAFICVIGWQSWWNRRLIRSAWALALWSAGAVLGALVSAVCMVVTIARESATDLQQDVFAIIPLAFLAVFVIAVLIGAFLTVRRTYFWITDPDCQAARRPATE